MRSSCEADHNRQAKNSSAASGRIPISTSAEGKSPIDRSNVATASVTSETIAAANTPARTEGAGASAAPVTAGRPYCNGSCKSLSLTRR